MRTIVSFPFCRPFAFESTEMERAFQARALGWMRLPCTVWCFTQIALAIFDLSQARAPIGLIFGVPFYPLTLAVFVMLLFNLQSCAAWVSQHVSLIVACVCVTITPYIVFALWLKANNATLHANEELHAVIAVLQSSAQPELAEVLQRHLCVQFATGIIPHFILFTAAQFSLLVLNGFSWQTLSAVVIILVASIVTFASHPCIPMSAILGDGMPPLLGGSIYCILLGLNVSRLQRKQFALQYQFKKNLESAILVAQSADNILNHTLKNTMADAAAEIEMFLGEQVQSFPALKNSAECLRRGMRVCRHRQAYLQLIANEYQPVYTEVRLDDFGMSLAAGRNITVDFIKKKVCLDQVLCSLILDNALSNAFKHGCAENPEVSFSIFETGGVPPSSSSLSFSQSLVSKTICVTFRIRNRANPNRPPVTPQFVETVLAGESCGDEATMPVMSTRIGLQHSFLAAKVHGITLSLTQKEDFVLFDAIVKLPLVLDIHARKDSGPCSPSASTAIEGLMVYCIDDSPAARRLLEYHMHRYLISGTVCIFGKDGADVPRFMEGTLKHAHIAILDEHLDFDGMDMVLGSNLVTELRQKQFTGLVCIRSANSEGAAIDKYHEAGADLVFGKDVPIPQMWEEIKLAYLQRRQQQQLHRPAAESAPDSSTTQIVCEQCFQLPNTMTQVVCTEVFEGVEDESLVSA